MFVKKLHIEVLSRFYLMLLCKSMTDIKRKKDGDSFSTPLGVVVMETHWGIAGTTTPRTEESGYYMSMAFLLEELPRRFLYPWCL